MHQQTEWRGRFPRNEIISILDTCLPFNLAESTARDLRFGDVLEIVGLENFLDLPMGYGSAAGSAELRRAVADLTAAPAEHVITTNGVELGLALLALELCRRGDELVLAAPYFPPSRDLFVGMGVTVREVRSSFDRGYRFAPEDFAPLLSDKTRLVSIASPQSPSGVRTPPDVLTKLVSLIEERSPDALLFVDETYHPAAIGNAPTPPSAAALGPRVITGASLSKAHGAPALRVGWLTIADAALRERLICAKMNLVISGSPLNEGLAAALLRQGERVLGPRRTILQSALSIVEDWQRKEAVLVDWVKPDAGALCCMRLRADQFDDAAILRFWALLPEFDLQLGAGSWFGESDRIFRLGFGFLPLERLPPALDALSKALRAALVPDGHGTERSE